MLKRKIVTIIFALLLLSGMVVGTGQVDVTAQALEPAATITYNLYATDGYIAMADGTVVYIYGFVGGRANRPLTFQNSMVAPPGAPKGWVPGGLTTISTGSPPPTGGPVTLDEQPLAGNAQFPAPLIYATTSDVVQINLKNLGVTNSAAPNDPHTIHLHGLDVGAANDGVPETSVATVPANLKKTPGAGNIVVYMFAPHDPGTYMYHCHQEASIHVQMGMYGALVVYNPTDAAATTGPGMGFGGNLHGWDYTKDVVLLLSEFDLGQHKAEQFAGTAGGFNPVNYKPQYWFINGLSFPNTIHAGIGFNWGNWSVSHPGYDPFIIGSVGTEGPADKVLLRVINMGFETQPMHMHGYHAKVIGSDQRAWSWAQPSGLNVFDDTGLEKNTLLIGSGETYEWLIDIGQQSLNSTYAAGVQSRYDAKTLAPVNNDVQAFPAIPDPFIPGFTYFGGPQVGPLLVGGVQTQNENTEVASILVTNGISDYRGQFFPFHNHDDYKATNNGVYPGGMFTMIATLP